MRRTNTEDIEWTDMNVARRAVLSTALEMAEARGGQDCPPRGAALYYYNAT